MIGFLLSLSAAVAAPLPADDATLLEAVQAELGRATLLRLPGQPAPYHVVYEVLDGQVVTVGSAAGALTSFDHGPYRTARVEVRVGVVARLVNPQSLRDV